MCFREVAEASVRPCNHNVSGQHGGLLHRELKICFNEGSLPPLQCVLKQLISMFNCIDTHDPMRMRTAHLPLRITGLSLRWLMAFCFSTYLFGQVYVYASYRR